MLHSTSPPEMAPDCEISARSPAFGKRLARLALRRACGAMTPRQFGPSTRRPFSRVSASSCAAGEPGPLPIAAVSTTTAAAPFPAASAASCGTVAAGVAITTRSGVHGSSCRWRTVATPSIGEGCLLTRPMGPLKPEARRFSTTARPTERGRDWLPTTATARGRKIESRR